MFSHPTSAALSLRDPVRHGVHRPIALIGILALIITLIVSMLVPPGDSQAATTRPGVRTNHADKSGVSNSLAALWIANTAHLDVFGCAPGYDVTSHASATMENDCDEAIGPVAFTLVDGQYGTEHFTTSGGYPKNRATTHNLDFEDDYFADNAGEGIPAIIYATFPAGYDSVAVWCQYVALTEPGNNWGPKVMSSYGTAIQVAVDAGDTIYCSWFFGQDPYILTGNNEAQVIDLPGTEPTVEVERGPIIPANNGPLLVVTPPTLIEQVPIPGQPIDEDEHPPEPVIPGSLETEAQSCVDSVRVVEESPVDLGDDCAEPAQESRS